MPFEASAAWLVTPSSYFVDRIVPDCEQVFLPPKQAMGGHVRIGRGPLPELQDKRGRMAQLRRPVRHRRVIQDYGVFDLRRHSPQNWAHFLNQHLPLFFRACQQLDIDPKRATLVFPENIPGYVRAAAEVFELTYIVTDDVLEGEGMLADPTPWMAIRAAQVQWVTNDHVAQVMARVDALPQEFPENVFLARRGTRNIENQAEVETWLGARGFTTLYPEDFSPAEQLRLFRAARRIVAVHGAGQAPLLYAQPGGQLEHMVEILPCGHMTDVYRVMSEQVGCKWIGVRGKLKPEYVRPAYASNGIFNEFSLDSFKVDLTALARAFEIAEL